MIENRFARFVVVGIVNTIFGYGCFAILLYAGMHYTVALLLATILGVLFNFKSIGFVVFKSKNNRLLSRFIGVYAIVYVVNASGIKLLSLIGAAPYLGGAIMVPPVAILAYILNKRFVFNNDQAN